MEFSEKLQYLRKQQNMTQEQVAEQLYVSRTAVSKWESGKGYPNIESLKAISKLYSVSIDELLSGNELLELAETENRKNINNIYGLIFGVLDLIMIVFTFLPLFAQRDEDFIRSGSLYTNTYLPLPFKVVYFIALFSMTVLGIVEIIVVQYFDKEKRINICNTCSIMLHAAAVIIFAISQQPYITVFLFLLLMVKVVFILKKNRVN